MPETTRLKNTKDIPQAFIADSATDLSDIDSGQEQLNGCLATRTGMTAFREIPPGGSVPMIRWELVEARDAIESALESLIEGNIASARDQAKEALRNIQAGTNESPRIPIG